VATQPPLDAEHIAALEARVRARQEEVGYTGTLDEWLDQAGAPC
jgi:hypothetical protein